MEAEREQRLPGESYPGEFMRLGKTIDRYWEAWAQDDHEAAEEHARDIILPLPRLLDAVATLQALTLEREGLRGLLQKARPYVEEVGPPGTGIETTKESAEKSAALLAEIDAALARNSEGGEA